MEQLWPTSAPWKPVAHMPIISRVFWKTNDENTKLYQKVSYTHRRLSECKYERNENNIATLNTNITDINVSLT